MAGARPITHAESDSIIGALGRARDRLFVLAGQHLGLRMSELLSLTVGMVANGLVPKSEVVVQRHRLKGGRSGRRGLHGRTIPIHPDLASAIALYLADFPGGPPSPETFLFQSRKGWNRPIGIKHAWRLITDAAETAGLNADRVSCHALRKTFAATIYEESGHDLRATQALLGHTKVETTVKYIEPDRDRLDSLVRGMTSRARTMPATAALPDPRRQMSVTPEATAVGE